MSTRPSGIRHWDPPAPVCSSGAPDIASGSCCLGPWPSSTMRSQLSFRALQARATTASRCLPSPVAPFRGWPEPCPPARATVNARATEDARARATSRARSFDCLATEGAPRGTATVHERARSSPDTHGAMGRDSTAQVSRRGCRVTRRLFATWEPVRGSRRGRAPSSGREPRPWTRLRLCRRIPPCPGAQGLGCSPAGTAATASCPRAPANLAMR